MTSFASNSNSKSSAAVLFLDVDGVLCTERCVMERYDDRDDSLYFVSQLCPAITARISPLEKSRVAVLKWIIEQIPHLKIVISSSWRFEADMYAFLLSALEAGGINTAQVVLGGTPYDRNSQSCRGSEIVQWLSSNPIYGENFVIVDDGHITSFDFCGLSHRFVKTWMHGDESKQGLCQEAAEKILHLLLPSVESSVPLLMDHSESFLSSAPAPVIHYDQGPKLIMLCGMPGIGKDSLCDFVFQHFPQEFHAYQCFSQDQFAEAYGPQKGLACRQAVEYALASGYSVILKRNNHTRRDRQAYVELAWNLGVPTAAIIPSEFYGNKSITLFQIACRSALLRAGPGGEGHETLGDAAVVPSVCSSFFRAFEEPTEHEVNHVRCLSFLTEDKEGEDCYVFPHPQPSSSLNAASLQEYQNFIPFNVDKRTGRMNSLSFCPTFWQTYHHQSESDVETTRLKLNRRRTKQAMAQDFVQILKDLSFL